MNKPVLTRRHFLEQLGAVGGSSLVFSAMTSWDLMAGSAGQRPELSGRPSKSKVVILGGGLSGMVVAYELGKLGYDYHLYEARERVGGLQWSVRCFIRCGSRQVPDGVWFRDGCDNSSWLVMPGGPARGEARRLAQRSGCTGRDVEGTLRDQIASSSVPCQPLL